MEFLFGKAYEIWK